MISTGFINAFLMRTIIIMIIHSIIYLFIYSKDTSEVLFMHFILTKNLKLLKWISSSVL